MGGGAKNVPNSSSSGTGANVTTHVSEDISICARTAEMNTDTNTMKIVVTLAMMNKKNIFNSEIYYSSLRDSRS